MARAPIPPTALLYSDYINDRAIIEALRLPPAPAGVSDAEWPDVAERAPGQDWPDTGTWRHEEVLFIRTHQAFECWFALIIHELTSVLRQAESLFARHGGAIARVELDQRRDESPGLDHARFPHIASAVQNAQATHGDDRRSVLDELGNPGRLGTGPGLPLTRELDRDLDDALPAWINRVDRAEKALLSTIPFFDVLATMTPGQFLLFRDRLQPASGFGSGQFRELELTLGMRELNEAKIRPPGGTPDAAPGEPAPPPPILRPTAQTPGIYRGTSLYSTLPTFMLARVAARYNAPSLRDLVYTMLSMLYAWGDPARRIADPLVRVPEITPRRVDQFVARALERTVADFHRGIPAGPLDPPSSAMLADSVRTVDRALAHREVIAAALLEMEAPDSKLNHFLNACQRVDAALLRWRDRHIRFVEHIIGMRRGTGGGGIQYLRHTTSPVRGPHYTHGLPALWQSRSFVQRVDA